MEDILILKVDKTHYAQFKLIESICKKYNIQYSYPEFTDKIQESRKLSEKETLIIDDMMR